MAVASIRWTRWRAWPSGPCRWGSGNWPVAWPWMPTVSSGRRAIPGRGPVVPEHRDVATAGGGRGPTAGPDAEPRAVGIRLGGRRLPGGVAGGQPDQPGVPGLRWGTGPDHHRPGE